MGELRRAEDRDKNIQLIWQQRFLPRISPNYSPTGSYYTERTVALLFVRGERWGRGPVTPEKRRQEAGAEAGRSGRVPSPEWEGRGLRHVKRLHSTRFPNATETEGTFDHPPPDRCRQTRADSRREKSSSGEAQKNVQITVGKDGGIVIVANARVAMM